MKIFKFITKCECIKREEVDKDAEKPDIIKINLGSSSEEFGMYNPVYRFFTHSGEEVDGFKNMVTVYREVDEPTRIKLQAEEEKSKA